MTTTLAISAIRTNGGTQPRSTIDMAVIEEYAQAMAEGASFPPPVVFFDGDIYWLADGFHRRGAAEALGLAEMDCDVRQGTQRDAVLFSVGANAAHGMRRTNEDKRRAVLTLLNDDKWREWSDGEISRRCSVDRSYVTKLRPVVPSNTSDDHQYQSRTFTHPKTGAPTTMNTANIGRSPSRTIDRSFSQAEYPDETDPEPQDADADDRRERAVETLKAEVALGYLHRGINAAIAALRELPEPEQTAADIPLAYLHCVTDDDAEFLADFGARFAAAWLALKDDRRERLANRNRDYEEAALVIAH